MENEELCSCELCGKQLSGEPGVEVYDGCICSACAARLSPWSTDLTVADTEELEEQVHLREENRRKLPSFVPTRCFQLPGMTCRVLLDDKTRTFLVKTPADPENPDLISLSHVFDARVNVEEDRQEIGRKRYRYTYRLTMEICLNHPYIDTMVFPLHAGVLTYESSEKSFLGFGGFDPDGQEDYQKITAFGAALSDALLDLEEEVDHSYDVENMPEDPLVVCPWCGEKTEAGSFCSHCGGNLT